MGGCLVSGHHELEMLLTSSTGNKWKPKSALFPVANGATVSASIVTTGRSGTLQVQLGLQLYAVRADKLDTVTGLGAVITTDTTTSVSQTLTAGSDLWGQLGYVYSLASGSAEGRIEIGMDYALRDSARDRLVLLQAGDEALMQLVAASVGWAQRDEQTA